jgi:sulfur transfer protein SufE
MTALRAWFARFSKRLLSMSRLKGLAAIFAITPKA